MRIPRFQFRRYVHEYIIQNTVPAENQDEYRNYLGRYHANHNYRRRFNVDSYLRNLRQDPIPVLPPVDEWEIHPGEFETAFELDTMAEYIPDLLYFDGIDDILAGRTNDGYYNLRNIRNNRRNNRGGMKGRGACQSTRGRRNSRSSDRTSSQSSNNSDRSSNHSSHHSDRSENNYMLDPDEILHEFDVYQMGKKAHKQLKFLIKHVINKLNVSNATIFDQMFYGNRYLTNDIDIEHWDVSNVTDMNNMFSYSFFNGKLNGWGEKTKNVTNMAYMFSGAHYFNQPINKWNVSKVEDMRYMFSNVDTFNQPLNDWDVSKVKDMSFMFHGADNFNQPLGDWNVKNVKKLSGMLPYNYNQNLNDWYLNDNAIYKSDDRLLPDGFFSNPDKIHLFPRNMKKSQLRRLFSNNPEAVENYYNQNIRTTGETNLQYLREHSHRNSAMNQYLNQPFVYEELLKNLYNNDTHNIPPVAPRKPYHILPIDERQTSPPSPPTRSRRPSKMKSPKKDKPSKRSGGNRNKTRKMK
jgi:surface protein